MFVLPKLSNKRGFTLIELIVVITLLSILSVVVALNFIDLTDEASEGSFEAVLGALKSSNAMNKTTQLNINKGTAIPTSMSCFTAANALIDGGLPEDHIVWPISWPLGGSPGQDHNCYLIVIKPTIRWDVFTITTTE